MSRKKSKNEVYRERNLLAMALAVRLHNAGGYAGWHRPEEGEWPVVWFRLPTPGTHDTGGQVGHHVQPFNVPLLELSPLPNTEPPNGYDGHTRRDRLNRLTDYTRYEA